MEIKFTDIKRKAKPRGSLFLIIGPSGAGKNTIINNAIKKDRNLRYIPSITTRPMRKKESQGKPYKFVSIDKFRNMVNKDELLEWQPVHDYHYGSSLLEINRLVSKGIDTITDMEVLGALDVMLKLPLDICTIFMVPPSEDELVRRIKRRNDESEYEINQRVKRATRETHRLDMFDYLIYNDNSESATSTLLSIVCARRSQQMLNSCTFLQGKSFVLHSIVFYFQDNCTSRRTKQPARKTTELPKTILGKFETPELTLKRQLHLLSLKAGLKLNVSKYKIESVDLTYPKKSRKDNIKESNLRCLIKPADERAEKTLLKILIITNKAIP